MSGAGSGKQLFLHILRDLSTRLIPDDQLEDTTSRLRAGLLFRGSTSGEAVRNAGLLEWGNVFEDGKHENSLDLQCIVTKHSKYSLEEILYEIRCMPELPGYLLSKCKGLRECEIKPALWAFWLIISSVQMYTQLLGVESDTSKEAMEVRIEQMRKLYPKLVAELDEIESGS